MEGVSLILQVLRFTCKLELVRLGQLRDALHQLCNLSLPLKLYSCQHTVIIVVILGALLEMLADLLITLCIIHHPM